MTLLVKQHQCELFQFCHSLDFDGKLSSVSSHLGFEKSTYIDELCGSSDDCGYRSTFSSNGPVVLTEYILVSVTSAVTVTIAGLSRRLSLFWKNHWYLPSSRTVYQVSSGSNLGPLILESVELPVAVFYFHDQFTWLKGLVYSQSWLVLVYSTGTITFPISQHFPVSRIIVRNHSPPAKFSGELSGEISGELPGEISGELPCDYFSDTDHTRRSAWRRSPTFVKAPAPKEDPRAGHAPFSGRRLHLTRRRVRAREAFSGDAPPPPASPARRPASLPTWFSHPSPARTSFGDFCLRQPSKQPFRRSSGYFLSTPIPARALGSVLLPFWWYHVAI
ncbi:hypothetical protein CK203_095588 [Vitis vinifera]|uniref:Uncharacterized protein n=1 Tax=Vitis vinifera TaxID=29760 RepID=A0A438DC18_VITVI|nr:hypothetical protein CK203_095588 [Vitis vinifera]